MEKPKAPIEQVTVEDWRVTVKGMRHGPIRGRANVDETGRRSTPTGGTVSGNLFWEVLLWSKPQQWASACEVPNSKTGGAISLWSRPTKSLDWLELRFHSPDQRLRLGISMHALNEWELVFSQLKVDEAA